MATPTGITPLDILGFGLGLFGASEQAGAAERGADATIRAAEIGAEAARFKPYAVTTGFGTSFFDEAGRRAGYELDPRLAAARDFYYTKAMETAQQLGGYSPQEMAAQVLAEQQGLLAPQRQAEDIALRQQQLQKGRIGLGVSPAAVGAGPAGGAVNPEQYAQQLARSRADAEMAAAAREYGQAEIDRLMGRAGGYLQSGLGVEELGLKPLALGGEFGGMASQAGAQAGQLLSQGLTNAASARYAGQSQTPAFLYDVGMGLMQQKYPATQQPAAARAFTPNYSLPSSSPFGLKVRS